MIEKLCLGPHHSCPKNWVWFRCNCYYISKEELTWKDSQRACSSLNSSLIRINREEMVSYYFNWALWWYVKYMKLMSWIKFLPDFFDILLDLRTRQMAEVYKQFVFYLHFISKMWHWIYRLCKVERYVLK